ncbi:hypothetical protein QQ054_32100 [Oscillatoria amoena NRMC-F 0135]|nr:hypothetical protein [Oscillatoria amoena NRMC-F 0135]
MPLEQIPITRSATIQNNIPGLAEHFWVAPITWFTLLNGPMVWAAAGDSAIIDADHTFAVGKGFMKLQLDYQKNMFEGKKVGEFGSKNREYSIKGYLYGLENEVIEGVSQLENTELALLVKKLSKVGAGRVMQFGIPDMYARLDDYNEFSGTVKEGYAGYELIFTVVQPQLYEYQGLITLKP